MIRCTSVENGTYCADIDYYNPRTTTQSSYRLTVGVSDGKLVRINFPNGGHIDESDFNPPDISSKSASFKSYENRQYKVKLVKRGNDCFKGLEKPERCNGVTKSGSRCKHLTDNESGLCWQHEE